MSASRPPEGDEPAAVPTSDAPASAEPSPETVAEILKDSGLSPDDPRARAIAFRALLVARRTSGPIPDPALLAEYDRVVPGLAREIVEAWHGEEAHRRALERAMTLGDEARMNRAQFGSWGIAAAGIVGALIAGAIGATWIGIVIAIVTIGGPAAATVLARYIASR